MSAQLTARSISLAALFALLGAAACSDESVVAPSQRPAAPRAANRDISVSDASIVLLSVDVSVPKSKQPLVYNLQIGAGRSAALATPAGDGRRLVVRGYDVYGNATHQGTVEYANIGVGQNEPVGVTLLPVGEGKPAEVRFDLVGEEPLGGGSIILEGGSGELNEGGTSPAIRATVLDRDGRRVDVNPRDLHWAVSDPKLARAKADDRGTAYMLALRAGYGELIAIYKDIIIKYPWKFFYDPYVQLTAGFNFTCGLRTSGVVACWGDNGYSQLAATPTTLACYSQCNDHQVVIAGGRTFKSISAGAYYVCGIETNNTTSCWGKNAYGQLGIGSKGSPVGTPTNVNTSLQFASITTGGDHACGVVNSANREAMCWGWNSTGQLGDGNPGYWGYPNPQEQTSPVLVAGGHHWLSLGAGKEHVCGVTTTNRAMCWGSNYYGEIGVGPFVSVRPTPDTVNTPISPAMQSVFSSANGYTTCWIRTGPIGSCQGSNDSGQVGKGASSTTVGQPAGLWGNPPLVMMSVGGKHVCGVDAADNLWCWGGNYYGQIANPNYYFLNHPQQPGGAGVYKFASVAAGGHHTCGLTRAAEVYCWGRNDRGQLGIGSVNSWKLTPTLIVP